LIVSEPIAEQPFPVGIPISLGSLQSVQSFTIPPHGELCHTEDAVADEPVDLVVLPVGDFDKLARQGERGLDPRREELGRAKPMSTEKRCKSVPTPASRTRFTAFKAAIVSGRRTRSQRQSLLQLVDYGWGPFVENGAPHGSCASS
jgi:hypothetical protein